MKKVLMAMLMVVSAAALALAEPQNRLITLKDGSTIQGKILSIEKGSYVIESLTLGFLHVKETEVVSIVSPGAAPQPAHPSQGLNSPAAGTDLQAVQAQMMSDPNLMGEIQSIASDPEVVALVSDPAFMQAAQAKDMAAIQANPRTAQLMQNPKVKALIEKMQASRGH